MREKKMLRRTAAGMIAAVLMAGGISTAYAAETPGLSLGNDGAVAAEISLLQAGIFLHNYPKCKHLLLGNQYQHKHCLFQLHRR